VQIKEIYFDSLNANEVYAMGSSNKLLERMPEFYAWYFKEIKTREIFWSECSLQKFITREDQKFNKIILGFDFVVGGILLILLVGYALKNAIESIRRTNIEEVKKINKNKSDSLQKAIQLFNNKFYNETIIESFRVIELFLKEKLLEKNDLFTKNFSVLSLIELAENKGILDKDLFLKLKDLRGLRNSTAHSTRNFTRKDAKFALDLLNQILEKDINDNLDNE
jgi:HEPN domain-containing protein